MAIRLQKTTNSGVTCDYWRILGVHYDVVRGVLSVDVGLYVSADTRAAGNGPAEVRSYGQAGITASSLSSANVFTTIYDLLKAQPDFQGAVDC